MVANRRPTEVLPCMVWIYLAESEVSHSHWKGTPSQLPTVKMIPSHNKFCCPECPTGHSQLHPSGMTLEHSVEGCYLKSTLFMAVSHVRTSASQVVEGAWKASEAVYFEKSCGWPKKSSPSSYSLKTSQTSAQPDSATLLNNWPIVGMTVDGFLYPLKKSEPLTSERDGFFWPTPTARANRDCPGERRRNSLALEPMINFRAGTTGGKMNPNWVEWLMGYPTTWTVVEPWAMLLFQHKRGKHLKDLAA